MKGLKMKLVASVVCGALTLGGVVGLTTANVQNAYADTPELTATINFNEDYAVGTVLTLPSSQITVGSDTFDAETVVRFPSGDVYAKNEITLSEAGKYTVEYRAISATGELFVVEKSFRASNSFFQVSGVNSSAYHGTVENAPAREGVVASIAEGERLVFNQVVNISDYTKSDIIAEAFVAPIEQGLADALNVSFVLTDAYNSENYVVITNKRLDRTPLEAVWQERSYATANAVDQPATGLDLGNGDFLWENNAYALHQNDLYGTPVKDFYMAGIPKFSLTTGIGAPTDIATQSLKLSMDYAEKRVYMNGLILADLDDTSMFKQVQWEGFTTGECLLSVYASFYNQNTFNCVVTKWGEYEGAELNQGLLVDTQAPTLTLDYGEYEGMGYPDAVVGRNYPLPKIIAKDDTDRNVSIKAKVYKDYGTQDQVNVKVKNGAFTPAYKGAYTIVYTATDEFGNRSSLEYPVQAVVVNEPLTIALAGGENQVVAGNVIQLPTAQVQNAQGLAKLKVIARHGASGTEEEISIVGENAYTFRPLYAGAWEIVYEYSDYMETKTQVHTVTVESSQKPYIYEDANLPKYLIRGAVYPLPIVKGVYLETGEPVETTASAYIIDDTKPERAINATRFVSYADEKATIIYRMGTGENVVEKRYEIPVVDVGYDTLNLRIADYFIAENFSVQANEDITLTTTEKGTQSFSFIQALQTFDFSMLFHVSNGRNNLISPTVQVTLDLCDAAGSVRNVLIGVAGQTVAAILQGFGNILCILYILLICGFSEDILSTGMGSIAKQSIIAGERQSCSCAAVGEVGMLLYKVLQNRNQVECACYSRAGCGNHFTGEICAIPQKLAGNACTVAVGNFVPIAVDQVVVVVYIGLCQHNGLFAVGKLQGSCFIHNGAVIGCFGRGDVIQIHQDVAVIIKLLKDFGEFFCCNEVAVNGIAICFVRETTLRIGYQKLERKIRDLRWIFPGN